MTVTLNDRWEAFAALLVEEGRFHSQNAVVEEGLRLLEEREAKLADLRGTLDAAIARGGSHTDDQVANAVNARLNGLSLPNAAE